jgi:hypothetical protein
LSSGRLGLLGLGAETFLHDTRAGTRRCGSRRIPAIGMSSLSRGRLVKGGHRAQTAICRERWEGLALESRRSKGLDTRGRAAGCGRPDTG